MADEGEDDAGPIDHRAVHERQRRVVAERRAERDRLLEKERRLRAELRRVRAGDGRPPA